MWNFFFKEIKWFFLSPKYVMCKTTCRSVNSWDCWDRLQTPVSDSHLRLKLRRVQNGMNLWDENKSENTRFKTKWVCTENSVGSRLLLSNREVKWATNVSHLCNSKCSSSSIKKETSNFHLTSILFNSICTKCSYY